MLMRGLVAALTSCLGATALAETAVLESTDGRKITVELLEKGKDQVRVKMGRKTFMLPLERLSEASVERVKSADIPTISNFKVMADFDKRSDEVSQDRTLSDLNPDGTTTHRVVSDSYRVDTITGSVTVQNRDSIDSSPEADLYVVTLCRGKKGDQEIRRDVLKVPAIEPLGEQVFKIGESRCWHTQRGLESFKPHGIAGGRYRGYVAAVVIDGRIASVKTLPDSYARDLPRIMELIRIGAPQP